MNATYLKQPLYFSSNRIEYFSTPIAQPTEKIKKKLQLNQLKKRKKKTAERMTIHSFIFYK